MRKAFASLLLGALAVVATACPALPAATPAPSPTIGPVAVATSTTVTATTSPSPATAGTTPMSSPTATSAATPVPVGSPSPIAPPAPTVASTHPAPSPTAAGTPKPAATSTPVAFSQHYEITAADNGQTFVYPVTTRFMLVLDRNQYPPAAVRTNCDPPGTMGSISNLPAVAAPLYALRWEGTEPGRCALSNGDFKVTVVFAMP